MARIVVGVGGSIAAWKACDVVSKLVQAGHVVDVVLTEAAQWFVRPLAFSGLTQRRVFTDEGWGADGAAADHLHVTTEADLLLVAPCTANLLGKLAHGIADDILTTTWIGCHAATLLAPAMNARMWAHPAVQRNVEILRGDGAQLVGPVAGWLAEGEEGPGRLAEPVDILAEAARILAG